MASTSSRLLMPSSFSAAILSDIGDPQHDPIACKALLPATV